MSDVQKRTDRVEVPCEDGVVEARRTSMVGEPWLVSFPFGDRRFYGDAGEVKVFIKRQLREAGK